METVKGIETHVISKTKISCAETIMNLMHSSTLLQNCKSPRTCYLQIIVLKCLCNGKINGMNNSARTKKLIWKCLIKQHVNAVDCCGKDVIKNCYPVVIIWVAIHSSKWGAWTSLFFSACRWGCPPGRQSDNDGGAGGQKCGEIHLPVGMASVGEWGTLALQTENYCSPPLYSSVREDYSGFRFAVVDVLVK